MIELSLRPYPGRLFVTKTKRDYQQAHQKLFAKRGKIPDGIFGRCTFQCRKGAWQYLVWAETLPNMAHELAHVVFHVFGNCGIDPRSGDEEPFCYLLAQLISDAQFKVNDNGD